MGQPRVHGGGGDRCRRRGDRRGLDRTDCVRYRLGDRGPCEHRDCLAVHGFPCPVEGREAPRSEARRGAVFHPRPYVAIEAGRAIVAGGQRPTASDRSSCCTAKGVAPTPHALVVASGAEDCSRASRHLARRSESARAGRWRYREMVGTCRLGSRGGAAAGCAGPSVDLPRSCEQRLRGSVRGRGRGGVARGRGVSSGEVDGERLDTAAADSESIISQAASSSSDRASSRVGAQVTTSGHSARWAIVKPFSAGVKTAVRGQGVPHA